MTQYASKEYAEIGAKMDWLAGRGELTISSSLLGEQDHPRHMSNGRGWRVEFHMRRPVKLELQYEVKELNDALSAAMRFVKLNMEMPT